MTIVKFNLIWFAVAVAILCGCSFAQNQESDDAPAKRKWLTCDVDWIFTPYDVGTDFSVKLSFRQAPLPGIRVVLSPSGELADTSGRRRTKITAVTDSTGTARFFAVPAGKYTASAENGLLFPSNEVTVHTDGDFDNEIGIDWPVVTLPVRALRGMLIAPGEGDEGDRPFQLVKVQLVDIRSSRVIASKRTTPDGSYKFSTIEPGLYVVRIIPPSKDKKTERASAELALELDLAAQEPTIPEMKVLQSECAGVQLLRRIANDRWEAP